MFEGAGALSDYWYVVAFAREVRSRSPCRVELWGTPLALWRAADGRVTAMLDRCPHRDVPLSKGAVRNSTIRCPYHGWRFDPDGKLVHMPTQGPGAAPCAKRAVRTFPVREQDGMIWVWPGVAAPSVEPQRLDAGGMRLYRCAKDFTAQAIDLVENFMDSPHTGVVHRGLIRGHKAPAKAVLDVEADASGVRVTHAGGPGEMALGRGLFAKRRGAFTHSDRFMLPAAVRVDYQLGGPDRAFLAYIFCTPLADGRSRAHVTLGVRFGWLTPLVRLFLPVLTAVVLRQDAAVMRWQRDNLETFARREGDGFVESDIMHVMVRELWQWAKERRRPFTALSRRVEVHL
jgi:phenylpropionate dioxygenase-like ring-hydroxylating dioxygenase large terminal subunit